MRHAQRVDLAILLVALIVAGCGSSVPSVAPSISPIAPTASSAAPSGAAVPSATAASSPRDPFLGSVVVTVSDRLRVRSTPEISDASLKYEPVLPLGTQLRVVGGPVTASDYVWYEVTPVSFPLSSGVDRGWVAIADHDGQPWIALAEPPIAGLELATSVVARASADPKAAKAISTSVTTFGLDLYREMLAEPALGLRDKNVVFSPTSIALALAMARGGAKSETASQMDAVLRTAGWGDLQAGLNALDQALASRGGTYKDDEEQTHELALRIANASFAQRGWSVEPEYLDAIATAFGAGLRLVDYSADPEAARKTINAWVSQQTAKRIPELLLPPNVSTAARLYLVNAIYLKANWVAQFPTSATAPTTFTGLDGSKATVPTMRLAGGQEVPYLRGDGWQATELRYRGPEQTMPLSMTLIVPDDLRSFESSLTAKQLGQVWTGLTKERTRLHEAVVISGAEDDCGTYPYTLDLFMPRFKVGTRAELKEALTTLGMPLAFDPGGADFTGIHRPTSADDTIHIANVVHQANIDVDEKGTVAAAATAVGMDTGGCTGPLPGKTVTLRLDRPFLFVLRDIETGAVLFMGRVVDPSK